MSSLQYSFIDQFHLLRHFSVIDEDYRKELIANTSFTDENINGQLALSGSKFHSVFVNNPMQLWEKIQSHKKFLYPDILEWKEKRFVVILLYDQEEYHDGVGEDSLISINDLLPAEKALLQKQDRDGIIVNHITINRSTPSWQVNIVLGKEKEIFVRTIFPGIYAPPFPDPEGQKATELIESKRFWDQHAFVYMKANGKRHKA